MPLKNELCEMVENELEKKKFFHFDSNDAHADLYIFTYFSFLLPHSGHNISVFSLHFLLHLCISMNFS